MTEPRKCPQCQSRVVRHPHYFCDTCPNPDCSWDGSIHREPAPRCLHQWLGPKTDLSEHRFCPKCRVYLLDYVRARNIEMGVPLDMTHNRPPLIDERLAR